MSTQNRLFGGAVSFVEILGMKRENVYECHLVLENFAEKILQPLQVLNNISNFILIERDYWKPNNTRLLSHFSRVPE